MIDSSKMDGVIVLDNQVVKKKAGSG